MRQAKTMRGPEIAPRVLLREIMIELPPHGVPVITMRGEVSVLDRRVGRVSEARIVTSHLTEAGRTFIESMTEAFGTIEPTKRGETAA